MGLVVNNYSAVNFKGINKVHKYTDEEKMEILTKASIDEMKKRVEYEVPEYGHFRAIEQIFDIPGSVNEAYFTVQHNSTAPKDKRSLYIGVRKPRTNKNAANLMADGSKKEIMQGLDKLDAKSVAENLKRISAKVDSL